jgi:hypothetical protein
MAATASPYGLVPVKNADGSAYNGARDAFQIASGLANNIGYGSLVKLDGGRIELALGSGADATTNNFAVSGGGAAGVFVGCEYVNAQGQLIFDQFFPTATTAPSGTKIIAYVVTDPGVTYQVQSTGAVPDTDIGQNCTFSAIQNATTSVNTTTGKSNMAVGAAQTATAGFKIVGTSDRGESVAGDAKTDLLVKINAPYHLFGTGVVSE